jgi:hypothetical protein
MQTSDVVSLDLETEIEAKRAELQDLLARRGAADRR